MRIVLLGLVVVGMALCTRGIGRVAANGDWVHPLAILGYALGVAALVFAYAGLFHRKVWFISTEKQAIIAIVAIVVIKFIVGAVYAGLKK